MSPQGGVQKERKTPSTFVNFSKLDIKTLQRYRKHFRLQLDGKTHPNKSDLVAAITKHFASHTVDEAETLATFIAAAKRAPMRRVT
eukprot:tig00000076_g2401.t1